MLLILELILVLQYWVYKWKSQEVKMGRLGSKGSSLAAVMELLGSRLVGVYIVSWR